ncbi:ABC1 kinase family protein [Bacillus testis]|uniref:ABC1 kinase family protein n=1 Tax=Bacillus testis TaxID=1622072 RepID=UPI00067E6AA1|nr:AarF/UbiB family protein [Bacillus testis]
MSKEKRLKTKKQEESTTARLKEIVNVLKRHEIIHGMTPVKLRLILEDLGPTYVKIGQIMSMRSDVLSQRYCDELAKLRGDVKPLDFNTITELIEQEYGLPAEEVFPKIEEKPLGSASMAQVHKVIMKDGRQAVIKVQRPGIKETMARDISLIRKAAKLLKLVDSPIDAIDFNGVLEEMWIVAQQEMDFILEANHCRELTELNEGIRYIGFPQVEYHLSTSKILVMEYVEGIEINQLDRLRELGYDLHEIGIKLAANYVKQVLDDGVFHADPHPGNIWIRDGKIMWLDLGMVGRLGKRDQQLITNAVKAIVDQDIFELKNVVVSLGNTSGRINHSLLYEDIEDLLNKYRELDFGNLNLGDLVSDMLDLCHSHKIQAPSGVTMLARGILTIEGVLRDCCPEVNFMEIAVNHLTANTLKDFDLTKEMQNNGKSIYLFAKKASQIPGQLSDLLKVLLKGQAKFNLDVTGAEEPTRQLDHMVDKMIICIISASLLIGSSLISTTQMKPLVLDIPLFGIMGFLASTVLSGFLLVGVIKKRWKK